MGSFGFTGKTQEAFSMSNIPGPKNQAIKPCLHFFAFESQLPNAGLWCLGVNNIINWDLIYEIPNASEAHCRASGYSNKSS